MINAEYVYDNLDKMTREEIRFTALSPQFKLFLQAMQDDCNQQLTTLDSNEPEKLIADYKRIAMTRDVYADLLALLINITTEEGREP